MFVVVKIHLWNHEIKSQVFPTEEAAIEGLQKSWEDTCNENIDNIRFDVDTFHEDDYAIMTFEDGDRIQWYLTAPETLSNY